ncbi:MAG TPA: hypothetical protein VLA80_04095 [Actinomycetota bacterium]|nr:hypothetical protein [Actinomycetota bacterium]
MRPVRILLVAIAVVAVGLAGWALGARGGYSGPDDTATATTAAPQGEPAAAPAPAPDVDPAPEAPTAPGGGGTPDDSNQPAPRPRIAGFGSEPVLPTEGGFWRLSPGGGLLTFVLDAQHATRVEFWLTPTGTNVGDLSRKIGQDTNGRDGWLFNWHYPNEPMLAHLTVKAVGPGGTAEQTVGVYHPDPAEQS